MTSIKGIVNRTTHHLLLILFLLFSSYSVFAQACGQAVYTIEFYTPNGDKEQEFEYEVIPINLDSLNEIYSLYGFSNKFEYDPYIGTLIEERFTDKLIDYETQEVQEGFEKILSISANEVHGKTKKAMIVFQTYETWYMPVLIKVTSGKKKLYIVANPFGGCEREAIVLWNDRPQIVRK